MMSLARGARRAAHRLLQAEAPLRTVAQVGAEAGGGRVLPREVADAAVPHIQHYPSSSTRPRSSRTWTIWAVVSNSWTTPPKLARRRAAPAAARGNAVILTFDDGFAECATVVAPVLRRRGLRCVFFVVTGSDRQPGAVPCESAASLCIGAIVRMPYAEVKAIVAELGIGSSIAAARRTLLAQPTDTRPFGLADLGPNLDPRLSPLLRWLLQLTAGEEPRAKLLLDRLGA